jgi:upstream stimulatory factor
LLPANGKEDCHRNVTGTLLASANNGRGDQGRGTYLEHINPESKDIRRRVSHNEVERRRRDRINTWISELYKLLPPDEQAKSQYQSKGIVLKRVCEYFQNVDSMLKAANAAVEQTRVENGLLRQRVRDLQQENQLLSASLQLGAAAAAAQLKHRQPQSASNLHSSPGEASGVSDTASGAQIQQEEQGEPSDYPASVTVFTVGSNTEYSHGGNFNQINSTCTIPAESATTTSFAAAIPNSINSSPGVFVNHSTVSSTASTASNMLSSTTRPLPLPSLDLVANHSDSRTE